MKRLSMLVPVLSLLLGCSGENPATCAEGATACFDGSATSVLVCAEARWTVEACGEGELCHEGACRPLTCVPGSKTCLEGKSVTCSGDGSVWSAPVSCGGGEACHAGACLPVVCSPGAVRCGGAAASLERCNAAGTGWSDAGICGSGTACVEGTCLANDCTPGDRACGESVAYVCGADRRWQSEACADGKRCAFGQCLACLADEHCGAGELCESGTCIASPPTIVTETLPEATLNTSYTAIIEVRGGLAPYTFALTAGVLPAGLLLESDGRLVGQPSAAGTESFTVKVTDARQASDTRALVLDVLSAGELRLTTTSLPPADLDYPYSVELKAAGGVPPYAWQSLQPLPAGLSLGSNGRLEGTPAALGQFPLTIRVLDVRTPPAYAARDFTLNVRIAPLEIIGGEQQINLFVTKILTLPLIVPFLPYSERLEARGGLKPYTWTIEPPPSIPFNPITQWGLPNGLSLAPDGRISGSVTDLSSATTVQIPFTSISLTGFFFYARVTDSQTSAEKKEAIYFIPTVPL